MLDLGQATRVRGRRGGLSEQIAEGIKRGGRGKGGSKGGEGWWREWTAGAAGVKVDGQRAYASPSAGSRTYSLPIRMVWRGIRKRRVWQGEAGRQPWLLGADDEARS
jgi:hypothetical protein